MTSRPEASRSAAAPTRARTAADVRAMVKRFEARAQPRVAELAASHRYVEDLMWSFPAALHALAVGGEACPDAARAVALVRAGAPLTAVAEALALPMWLTALPPEAFAGRAPPLPASKRFARRIVNHLPRSAADAQRWLAFVAKSDQMADEHFALWIARHFGSIARQAVPLDLAGMALHAWFSARPQLEAAQVMQKRWHAAMSMNEAARSAGMWLERLDGILYGAPHIVAVAPCTFVDGYEFVQIATASELFSEADALSNCLAEYSAVLSTGMTQIWSIRQHDERIGALEITVGAGIPLLVQVRGPFNADVSQDALHAVYRWLLTWPMVTERPTFQVGAVIGRHYRRIMMPYWQDKGLVDYLPLRVEDFEHGNMMRRLWQAANSEGLRRRARQGRRHR